MGLASGMPHLLIPSSPVKKKLDLFAYKRRVDPNNILNPGKFFSINSNVITALLFHPVFFNISIGFISFLSPVIGKAVTLFFGKNEKVDTLIMN